MSHSGGKKKLYFVEPCNLINVKLYLNFEFYPYNDLNVDFGKNRYAILFDMYAHFRKAYHGYDCYETLLTDHVSNEWSFCGHWLLTTKRVHQKRHCRYTNRIWLQRECTRKYYFILSHLTSCDWILSVVQRSAQDHVNCEYHISR